MIYDHDLKPLLSVTASIQSNEEKVFDIYIDCKAGYYLRASVTADLQVLGKHDGHGGFTNIETTGIDLTPFDGDQELFKIKVVAGTITTFDKRAFRLIVSP